MWVLVVGPSGAGKDTLLNAARAAFAHDPRVCFVRRAITRPADPAGEDHEPLTPGEFAARPFALSWTAHGLSYGIPFADAPVVVANVSRGAIVEAAARWPVHILEVTAPPEVLAARLAARGRETAADAARRLARTAAIPDGVPRDVVINGGALADGIARFNAALGRIAGLVEKRSDL